MKLAKATKISTIVLEYAKNPNKVINKSSGKRGISNGKNIDSIAVGAAKPYKDNTYLTKYEKEFPKLAKLTQRLKEEEPDGSMLVIGPPLDDLLLLLKDYKRFKQDEKGRWILPLGDNIRLSRIKNQFFLKYIKPEPKQEHENVVPDIK